MDGMIDGRPCRIFTADSPMGIERTFWQDEETGEILHCDIIDGGWHILDGKDAQDEWERMR